MPVTKTPPSPKEASKEKKVTWTTLKKQLATFDNDGLIALLHIVTMVLTQTRGTVLGFLGGAFVATVLIAILERERKVLRYSAIGALLFVVAILGMVSMKMRFDQVSKLSEI